jgi:anti-sigma factor RsiW
VSLGNDRLLDLIQADLDGALSAAERAELARLLLQDPEARRLHGQLQRTDQLLRDIPAAEPPAGLREAVITGPARPREAPGRWNRLSTYRIAAAFVGGLLVVGAAYFVNDGRPTGEALQGSVSAGKDLAVAAAERHVSLRAEGFEVDATLRSDGEILHLEIASLAATPGELAVKIDPAATSLAGSAGDASVTAAGDEVGVQLPAGRHVRMLDFSGSAPIRLELRADGRVLGQAELPVTDP